MSEFRFPIAVAFYAARSPGLAVERAMYFAGSNDRVEAEKFVRAALETRLETIRNEALARDMRRT